MNFQNQMGPFLLFEGSLSSLRCALNKLPAKQEKKHRTPDEQMEGPTLL
jgi:hypothetical protein